MKTLFMATGTLKVTAAGYWFTSGGEKGSFGYYPHLKDENGFPLYPDTQIHGDLRMAFQWYQDIERFNDITAKDIFGDSPDETNRESSSKLLISDLVLVNPPESSSSIFHIKPRTAINDKRVNEEQMLVDLELAYMDDKKLKADVFIGYFDSKEKLCSAIERLKKSLTFLSGFGAFRSRGYGRAKEITLELIDAEITIKNIYSNSTEYTYLLKNLRNLRNRQVSKGSSQLVSSRNFLTSEQVRGWFVWAYQKLTGDWPTFGQMKSINFSDFYPSLQQTDAEFRHGYPPPMTTMEFENKKIEDISCQKARQTKEIDKREGEGYTKPKPFGGFITNKPEVFLLHTKERMRNSIDSKFTTKEGGLFTQEYIPAGIWFGGKVTFQNGDTSFIENAVSVLTNSSLSPIINGCLFEQTLKPIGSIQNESDEKCKKYLVISPIIFDKSLFDNSSLKYIQIGHTATMPDANQLKLDTLYRYNRTLKRPRRNRVIIAPGSVLNKPMNQSTIQWKGFGTEIESANQKTDSKKPASRQTLTDQLFADLQKEENKKIREALGKMSRSQAGQLREFISPSINDDYISQIISERKSKYEHWKKEKIDERLIPEYIFNIIENCKSNEKKAYIKALLREYHLLQYETKKKEILKKFEEKSKEAGYINKAKEEEHK